MSAPYTPDSALQTVNLVTDFGLNAFRQAAVASNGNFIVSPVSFVYIAALLYFRTGANTRVQFQKAMKLDPATANDDRKFMADAKKFEGNLTCVRPPSLANADCLQTGKVYLDNAFPFKTGPAVNIAANYTLSMDYTNVPFKTDAAKARDIINKEVAQESHNRIPDLLPLGAVTPATKALVVSIMYFKSKWLKPFSPGSTKKAAFTMLDGKTMDASMMTQTESFRFYEVSASFDPLHYLSSSAVSRNINFEIDRIIEVKNMQHEVDVIRYKRFFGSVSV